VPRASTFVFSFKVPYVKDGGDLAVPVLLSGGEWGELVMTPGTLRNLGEAITQHFDRAEAKARPAVAPSPANPSLRQPMLKRCGKIL